MRYRAGAITGTSMDGAPVVVAWLKECGLNFLLLAFRCCMDIMSMVYISSESLDY